MFTKKQNSFGVLWHTTLVVAAVAVATSSLSPLAMAEMETSLTDNAEAPPVDAAMATDEQVSTASPAYPAEASAVEQRMKSGTAPVETPKDVEEPEPPSEEEKGNAAAEQSSENVQRALHSMSLLESAGGDAQTTENGTSERSDGNLRGLQGSGGAGSGGSDDNSTFNLSIDYGPIGFYIGVQNSA